MSLRYCNPVHDGCFADPFVMEAPASGSRYVAIGTGSTQDARVFEVLVSDDLTSCRSVGGALEPPSGCGSDDWAPEVAEHDGRWWMYCSCGEGDKGQGPPSRSGALLLRRGQPMETSVCSVAPA